MVFSSLLFIFIYLPAVLGGYLIIGHRFKTLYLLICSLIFYAWGEPHYIYLLIVCIITNYIWGILLEKYKANSILLCIAIISNLSNLVWFKYANFISSQFGKPLGIIMPIGISFYTFQAMSYCIDVYRRDTTAEKNPLNLALYISFFPQLIAGPIVKYKDIAQQLHIQMDTIEKRSDGFRRFVYGLGKKVLIANTLGYFVDNTLTVSNSPNFVLAWTVAIYYSLQIYFDFSGYSDMAIGLGLLFGFSFQENFNRPYICTSITDFWRRWHISLGEWFKQYVYIPLGGNRCSRFRTLINLFIVFILTGIWHGANWNFLLWGIYNSIWIILERTFLLKTLKKNKYLSHIYSLIVISTGWIIFRIENITEMTAYLSAMFLPWLSLKSNPFSDVYLFINHKQIVMIIIGIVLSGTHKRIRSKIQSNPLVESIILFSIFALSILSLASDTYNPFIYYRF